MSDLIVFDLDGVITSEEAYWDAAGLTLHELCYSPRYWHLDKSRSSADGQQYHPATNVQESRSISRAVFPETEILALKARAINSNWDTCYVAVCLCLIDLLAIVPNISKLLPLRPWDAEWLADFRIQISGEERKAWRPQGSASAPLHFTGSTLNEATGSGDPCGRKVGNSLFDSPIFKGYVGLELINCFDVYASQVLGYPIEGVFSRHSPFWAFCRDIFQEWYLGDDLYTQTYGHAPAQLGKPGCIHFERPLLPLEQVRATLETLRQQGYVLGFATGRTYQEAVYPLDKYGLLGYFDEQRISTYDYVERAEAELRIQGDQTLLGKPHPFQFLVAAQGMNALSRGGYEGDMDTDERTRLSRRGGGGEDEWRGRLRRPGGMGDGEAARGDRTRATQASPPPTTPPPPLRDDAVNANFVVVGDSTSDILGGRAAGALTVAVLTGVRTPEARQLLAQSKPDFTIDDVTKLPDLLVHIDSLATIQHLQFSEREKAERLLQRWFARHMMLHVESVTLIPKAVSLNSFNGVYRLSGEEYFFKTHVEEQGVLEEYYHADLLHQAGYNIVKPLQTMHEGGRQMVIYPVVRWPVMFDLVRAVETGNAKDGTFAMVLAAEKQACERLLAIYDKTLAHSTAQEHAHAPIHQLFWHRLAGGRLKSFYEGKRVPLPGRQGVPQGIPDVDNAVAFEELLKYRWTIYNSHGRVIVGKENRPTLGQLIERARLVLNPARETMTVIGHGDAHYGNVFLEDQKNLLYFDPAFAGRHSPSLDIVKPFFHNVFATWMYFPQEVAQDLQISVTIRDLNIYVEHNFELTSIRRAIFDTKFHALYTPLRDMLRSRGVLPADWMEIVWLAMMCCPLLTVNLFDEKRMPAAISWLGLAQAVEMGNISMNGDEE